MSYTHISTYIGKEGEVSKDEVTKADVIALYFSAHWCPPCRSFTPVLGKFYNEVNKTKKQLEIIFVSLDQDEAQFKEYHETMPFLAIPWKGDRKGNADTLGISGIPALLVLNKDGSVLTKNGRGDITSKSPQECVDGWFASLK